MYATVLDLVTRYGADELIQLTSRGAVPVTEDMLVTLAAGGDMSGYTEAEQTATQAVVQAVTEAIGDACSEMDPYLQGRYVLPLATTPRVLERMACDMARYHLHVDRATEEVTKRYDDAIAFLGRVAKGQVSLGLDETQAPAAVTGGVQVAAPKRVFLDENLRGYLG